MTTFARHQTRGELVGCSVGGVGAHLLRSNDDPRRFISYSEWSDARARDAWKQSEGCAAGFAACRAFCDDFQGGDFTEVVHI